ncbi:hydantoinase/oxoprolinase family protein [Nitrosococcus watsonii]|uniref:H4MPT-linked C1 transfer pathway protein n=1 Tax=Nitrosococcus watsoni (strain C-113) TaxID=105559 RepID=D8K9N5_NITWC|nr:hydantoinase/oxoprolinase family protein [Nitrosococcus watsonii]ADJ27324.1 H4MPT-linked C1 transfer pathway protein [Nitrosococcus watsonii C-113]
MPSKPLAISGWDIGGAHLKAALADSQGRIAACLQLPCPLWQGLEKLQQAFSQMQLELKNKDCLAAITMTGELADLFNDRDEGVIKILEYASQHFQNIPIYVFAGTQGFISLEQAAKYTEAIASANYLATSQLAARHWKEGLFLDIGSTTSDLIPCKNSIPCPRGRNDQERLASGELLYSGVTRTPLIALARRAPLEGQWVRLAAEWFATTADVYHLLGRLSPSDDLHPSADNRGKQPRDCARRLARMVGADSKHWPLQTWQGLAAYFAEQQCQQLTDAVFQVLSRVDISPEAPLIGAGIGRFLVAECARRLRRPYADFSEALDIRPRIPMSADHAPAAALARLAWEQLRDKIH